MATVSQGIKIGGGGIFEYTSAGTSTAFSTTSTQYAIVTVTNMKLIAGTTSTSANITFNSQIMLQLGSLTSTTAILAQGLANLAVTDNTKLFPPITLYVPPSTDFKVIIGALTGGGASCNIAGSYVIMQNV